MQQALADFHIESDRVIFLEFANGRYYRVDPADLGRFLKQDDLRRVRRALRLRQQFMRRILPPTVLAVVLVGIIGFGRYDMYRAANNWRPAPAPSQQQASKVVSVSSAPATSTKAPPAAVPASSSNLSIASGTNQSQSVTTTGPLSGIPKATPLHPVGTGATQLLPNVTPGTSGTNTVPQLLAPATALINTLVKQLPLGGLGL